MVARHISEILWQLFLRGLGLLHAHDVRGFRGHPFQETLLVRRPDPIDVPTKHSHMFAHRGTMPVRPFYLLPRGIFELLLFKELSINKMIFILRISKKRISIENKN
jgi:hypothetical protein